MASSLISGAVSLLLILIAGYVIATGILTISETLIYTQTDVSFNQENIAQTDISLDSSYSDTTLSMIVYNNGSTSFTSKDLENMELFVYHEGSGISHYTKGMCSRFDISTDAGKEYRDIINIGIWDPSEALEISINGIASKPDRVKFITSNGVTASSSVTAI